MKIQVNSRKISSFSQIFTPKLLGNFWGKSSIQFPVIISYLQVLGHQSRSSEIKIKWKNLKSFLNRKI